MCGIAGILRFAGNNNDKQLIQAMTDVISHRGPDDHGFLAATPEEAPIPRGKWAHAKSPFPIHFGHRRLSILDLSAAGRQPMASTDGTVWITYNGEAYNYLELRQELKELGYSFHTGTDTEVLLAAYQAWGAEFISRVNGMFAFALLDLRENRFFLFRDRFGIKPLFYHLNGSRLLFGSEIKCLLQSPDVTRTVNQQAVRSYLCSQILDHRPETFFEGINSLAPGHYMSCSLSQRQPRIHRYYNVLERAAAMPAVSSPVEAFRETFERSISYRLRSDVRVGACLSGGLDSSSIVCTLKKLLNEGVSESSSIGNSLVTFTSCHDDPRFDEREFVKAVTDESGANSIHVFSDPEELTQHLATLVWHQDEPFSSPAIYAQYCLMEAARRENVLVLLDGQGGDELLCGYRKFFFFYLKQLVRQKKPLACARELLGALLHGDENLLDMRAAKRYMPGKLGSSNPMNALLTKRFLAESSTPTIGWGSSLVERQVADIEQFSIPPLLRYEDRNSMAFGIETRLPFLDYNVTELSLALPVETKIKNGIAKHILRDAMRGTVPDAVLDRRTKMGFVMPEDAWLRGPLAPLVEKALTKKQSILDGMVDKPKALKIFNHFMQGQPTPVRSRDFFRLLCLDIWAQTHNLEKTHD
ncbi:asparagine synthase (glutamine-hydrolyzing) [Pseudodesulfovibrio methanolicus]|uniref:asparagine synthase (glutamine-hydrolyzing) n=1 Tax=Pseudodesulfovibrio methanolicus TaxID=3126690 RepID=A0ABZ2IX92_9BACT